MSKSMFNEAYIIANNRSHHFFPLLPKEPGLMAGLIYEPLFLTLHFSLA